MRFEMRDSRGLTIKVSVHRSSLCRRFARELSAVFAGAYNKRRAAGEAPLEASRVHLETPLGGLVSPNVLLQSIAPADADQCVLLVRTCLLLGQTDPTGTAALPATLQVLAGAGAPELAAHFFIVEQQESRDGHDWSRERALSVLSAAVLAIPGLLYRNAARSSREGSDSSSSPGHGLLLTRGWTAALAAAQTAHAQARRTTGFVINHLSAANCADGVSIDQVGMSVTDAAAAGVVQPFALVRANLLCLCDTLAQLMRIGAVVYCDRPPADDPSSESDESEEGGDESR